MKYLFNFLFTIYSIAMYIRSNHLGTPEDAFLMSSNEANGNASVLTGGKRKHKKTNKKRTMKKRTMKKKSKLTRSKRSRSRSHKRSKVMKGGSNYIEMTASNDIPMGPRGGIMSHNVVTASQPLHPPMSGGLEVVPLETLQIGGAEKQHRQICHDIKKVNHFHEVQQFWQSLCPGAVMLYQGHLQKLEKTYPKEIKKIVIGYTKAFCHEVAAYNTKDIKTIKTLLKKLKSELKDVRVVLKKINKDVLRYHEAIVNIHVGNIERFEKRIIQIKKNEAKRRKIKMTLKKKIKKMMKRGKKSKTMKGGYHQYMSNTPYSASYSVASKVLPPKLSALANPAPIEGNNVHGIDNYAH